MPEAVKSYVFVILSSVGYSTTAIFVKLAYLGGMEPLPLVSLRFFIAAWLMLFYLLYSKKLSLATLPQNLLKLGLPGFLGYGGAAVGFLLSLHYLKAPVASILLYTYPTMVTILSAIFFKEPFTKQRVFALIFTFSGIMFVINIFDLDNLALHPLGLIYSLVAALSYAFFNIYAQKNISNVSPQLLTFYPLVTGAILLPLISNPLAFLYTKHIVANFNFGLGLALFGTVLPMILYYKGLKRVKASVASIIASFEPVFTAILAAIILGDNITQAQIIGGILILLGVFVLQTEEK